MNKFIFLFCLLLPSIALGATDRKLGTGILEYKQLGSTPATPSVGYNRCYFKTDGKEYCLDTLNNEKGIMLGSGSSTDNALSAWDGTSGTLLKDSNIMFVTPDLYIDGGQTFLDDSKGVFWNYGSAHYGLGLNIGNFNPPILSGNIMQFTVNGTANNGFAFGDQAGATYLEIAAPSGLSYFYDDMDVDGVVTADGFTGIQATDLPAPASASISASDIDWATLLKRGGIYYKTLAANTTFTYSNMSIGCIQVWVTNTASNYTLAWPANTKWKDNTAPTQTVGAKTDIYSLCSNGSTVAGAALQNFTF